MFESPPGTRQTKRTPGNRQTQVLKLGNFDQARSFEPTLAGSGEISLSILEALPAGIVAYSADGAILTANPKALKILGMADLRPGAEVTSLFGCIPHEQQAENDGRTQIELSAPHLAGTGRKVGYTVQEVTLQIEGAPLDAFVVLFQDITDMAKLRQERDRYLRMATMSRLLPTVAHEIKNPLASIQALVELLLTDTEKPENRRDLETVLSELSRLRFIVDGMGLSNQDLTATAAECDVVRQAQEAIAVNRSRARTLGIEIAYMGEDSLMARLRPDLLRMIIGNLIANGLDASQEGGLITVGLSRNAGVVSLAVADNGCGMSQEVIEKATQPFFSTKAHGSGIGLALIGEVVERSGGRLVIDSAEHEGTLVTIHLPTRGAKENPTR